MKDDFDFGFTTVAEDELEVVQNVAAKVEESKDEVQKLQDKLKKLRDAIEPLLKNLEANPTKEYIHWPDRTSKVNAFRIHLDKIMKA
jgi:uncharacterized protein YpuA (DUF1002 family)